MWGVLEMQLLGGWLPGHGWSSLGLVVFCAFLAGCSSHQANLEQEQSNLKPLALFYGQFQGQRGRPPASEAEFKEHLRSMTPQDFAAWGVTDLDSIFVSSRDNQPYVVLYGDAAKNAPRGPADSPVIAYEKVGVGGKRFVASVLGAVEEVDEQRFKQLVATAP